MTNEKRLEALAEPCKHSDCKDIQIRHPSQGADEFENYKWCKNCGALHYDHMGYSKGEWTLPNTGFNKALDLVMEELKMLKTNSK